MCVRKEAGRTIIFMRYIFFSTWLQGTLSLVCMCFTMQMYMWYVNKSNASTENLGRWGGGGGKKRVRANKKAKWMAGCTHR